MIVVLGSFCSARLAHAVLDGACANVRVLTQQKAKANSRDRRADNLMINLRGRRDVSERTVSNTDGRAKLQGTKKNRRRGVATATPISESTA